MTSLSVGLALGGGSARGWAHIGVIRALEQEGIVPSVVAGTSIGALVGAAYVGNELTTLEDWVRGLTRRDVMRYLDFTLAGGGFIEGERLMKFFRKHIDPGLIEELERPFACVATELESGREVWLQRGDVLDAVRASYALPGLFTPVHDGDTWLVDGGLVNPVPVSVCRALGADVVIAVNLNGDILGKRNRQRAKKKVKQAAPRAPEDAESDNAWSAARSVAYTVLFFDPPDPTRGALWYHADYVKPSWAKALSRVTKIGRHIYYRHPQGILQASSR